MTKADMQPTKHHIVPSSKGGDNSSENIAMVKRHLHMKYHHLFENKTPNEILDFLVNYFWGGRREFVEDYLRGKMHVEQFNELFRRDVD